tara:strand:- start:836 stop:1828 length:993 start_codon:yes stop_codon:yes gene_type:complete
MRTKFAIGCLVQWYEVEIVEEYIASLEAAIEILEKPESVIVDICWNLSQSLEKIDTDKISLHEIETKFAEMTSRIKNYTRVEETFYKDDKHPYTIADYRRDFNDKYCTEVDVLMWGETDSLVPKQTFLILDNLHQTITQNGNSKYLAFFGTCKMWDDSWKPIEHNDFTDKLHSDSRDDWWSVNYTTNIEEMNAINDKVDELDVRIVSPHKFNGCGLVISSEVIKSGVNIPRSSFFIHEDTAFMMMTNKVLGDIPQYVIKNIFLVHNRKRLDKRKYIKGEDGNTVAEMRKSTDWYTLANKMCEQNYLNLFNPNYKSFTWDDVLKKLDRDRI